MEKVIFSNAKDSNGNPMWILMPDGGLIISKNAVDQAGIQHAKLSG